MNKPFSGLIAGPLIFLFIYFFIPDTIIPHQARAVLASTVWVALWWITEAVPIAVASLLPIVLFPLSGGLNIRATTAAYGNPLVFLFIGGFIIAMAIERWQLHRRIALHIIVWMGTATSRIILGFMLATALLSMWISNTATTLMMMPIGLSVVRQLQQTADKKGGVEPVFGKALMLSIAYAASIGGMATLIGTPTNVIFSAMVKQLLNYEITFASWFVFAFPLSVLLLVLGWLYLVRVAFPLRYDVVSGGNERIRARLEAMGPVKVQEKKVLIVFTLTALAWMGRSFILAPLFPDINDTIIALNGALLLFIIPSGKGRGHRLLFWEDAVKLPWGIILLFGGGLALAAGFKESGLALWLGERMHGLHVLPYALLILIVVASVNFLTEITSNVATASVILPVLAAMARAMGSPPLELMAAATIAASCAFMLPVATPPNAVVFGSGEITMGDMVRTGLRMNLISIGVEGIYVLVILPWLWGTLSARLF
ncbi:MAG: DASS family sodium-coupled anion symporter [Calditrichaeota bacterium]|nr:MAG: DASS family sodium-coupled anion symporter [Calditrichota bacterium]